MILADTGPLVALFDPRHSFHQHCVERLRTLREPIRTTVPVLTEAFHMLGPASAGSANLRQFVARGGLSVWYFARGSLERALVAATDISRST